MSLTLATYTTDKVTQLLKTSGIALKIGPFNINIESDFSALTMPITSLYRHYPIVQDNEFIDYNIKLKRSKGLRRFFRQQVTFYLDDYCPFKPLPYTEAFPLLEWGMNWVIAAHAHQYLIIHSAVIAKNGHVVILPGDPGSGKSTLCAALVAEGWQLLSDELALIDQQTNLIYPMVRPISLKNQSINLISHRYPELKHASFVNTSNKGDVAHFPIPKQHLTVAQTPLQAKLIVFPKYNANVNFMHETMTKPECFLKTVDNSFNYNQLGADGFTVMGNLIEQIDGYNITYNNLKAAISFIEEKME